MADHTHIGIEGIAKVKHIVSTVHLRRGEAGAYDHCHCYDEIAAKGAKAVIPPRKDA